MKDLTDLFRPDSEEGDGDPDIAAMILSPAFQAQIDRLAATGHLPHWEELTQNDFRRLKKGVRACFETGSPRARATSLPLFPDWGALLFMGLRGAAGTAGTAFADALRGCADYLGNDALRHPFDALLYGGQLRLDTMDQLEQAVLRVDPSDETQDGYLEATAAFLGEEGLIRPFNTAEAEGPTPLDPEFYAGLLRHFGIAEPSRHLTHNLLLHYLFIGAPQNWDPNSDFDSDWYLREYPTAQQDIEAQKLVCAFAHFLLIGKSANFRPVPPLHAQPVGEREAKTLFLRRAIRAAQAFDPIAHSFAPAGAPDISVIVPVCGQFVFTASLLRQAHFAKLHSERVDGLSVEIVVVSNGSADETDSVLSTVAGLRHLAFPEAIGFPRAVNAGAAEAKGDTLIILNNDILFEPDLFSRLAAGLCAEPELGLLGGAIVLPDQRLQELGCVVFSDGSGFGIARGEDPGSGFARAQMDVDYCSACAVAIARTDFEAFGGLDERFSPGYYEETDLCARLKAAGRRVAVDGTIQIEHFEHGSFAGGARGDAVQTLIARHRDVFRERHAKMLARQPDRPQVTRGSTLDPRTICRHRILLISAQVLAILPDGDIPASLAVAERAMAMGADVEFGVFEPSHGDGQFDEITHRLVKDWTAEEGLGGHIARSARCYSHLFLCEAPGVERFADALRAAREENPRLLVVSDESVGAEDGPLGDLVDVRMEDPGDTMLRSILEQVPASR